MFLTTTFGRALLLRYFAICRTLDSRRRWTAMLPIRDNRSPPLPSSLNKPPIDHQSLTSTHPNVGTRHSFPYSIHIVPTTHIRTIPTFALASSGEHRRRHRSPSSLAIPRPSLLHFPARLRILGLGTITPYLHKICRFACCAELRLTSPLLCRAVLDPFSSRSTLAYCRDWKFGPCIF